MRRTSLPASVVPSSSMSMRTDAPSAAGDEGRNDRHRRRRTCPPRVEGLTEMCPGASDVESGEKATVFGMKRCVTSDTSKAAIKVSCAPIVATGPKSNERDEV
mmetsp:Transcript_22585/g.66843  ORF Transcript_22585/g.66843 Transcript_22585/m.66843 type:complete len:103 (+) Transcript_22585:1290-1598(+)